MKITTNELKDELSISGLKDEEYTLLLGALKAAASDLTRKGHEYVHFYGGDRDGMVTFFNKIWAEDKKLNSN